MRAPASAKCSIGRPSPATTHRSDLLGTALTQLRRRRPTGLIRLDRLFGAVGYVTHRYVHVSDHELSHHRFSVLRDSDWHQEANGTPDVAEARDGEEIRSWLPEWR